MSKTAYFVHITDKIVPVTGPPFGDPWPLHCPLPPSKGARAVPGRAGATVISVFVCLSVRTHISETTRPNFAVFFAHLL